MMHKCSQTIFKENKNWVHHFILLMRWMMIMVETCILIRLSCQNELQLIGDVFVFEMTQETKTYHMILPTFIGTDCYQQSVTFREALLSNETVESFV